MLILSRKRNERIVITCGGESVTLVVCDTRPGTVRLGFEAPPAVVIQRQELAARIAVEGRLTHVRFESQEGEPVLLGIAE